MLREPGGDRDWRHIYRQLVAIAMTAAKYAREKSEDRDMAQILSRNPVGDLTRKIDHEIEHYIYEMLRNTDLRAYIVTEESGSLSVGREKPEYIFILDPLDGSINYIANVPYCSISIAVLPYRDGASIWDVSAGVVAEIFRDRYYGFIRGLGAFVGEEPAKNHIVSIYDAILAYFEEPDLVGRIYRIWNMLGKPKIRSLGAASLDIIYTSMGRFKAFVDLRGRLRNVDIAASIGFAREVGAYAVDDKGRPINVAMDRLSRIGSIIVTREKDIVNLIESIET